MEVVYVTVPEYQPSQATITLGEPKLYKPSLKAEDITVGLAYPVPPLVYVVLGAGGILAVWYLVKKRKKKRKKKVH